MSGFWKTLVDIMDTVAAGLRDGRRDAHYVMVMERANGGDNQAIQELIDFAHQVGRPEVAARYTRLKQRDPETCYQYGLNLCGRKELADQGRYWLSEAAKRGHAGAKRELDLL